MKLSQFTITVPDFPKAGKHLVHNTFNRATAVIGERAKKVLDNLDGPIEDDEMKHINAFRKLGLVVDDSVDEVALFKDWLDKVQYNKEFMRATILTTYDCNFACEYCVEEGVKKPVKMDEERCSATVDWLINRVEKYQSNKIQLHFYGGEPLMNVPPIEYISSKIGEYSEKKGISFGFNMTSNGALLKPDLVDRLTPLGLTSVRVTLDGDREGHNLKRPFKGGKGSFDVIIENMLQVMDKVTLKVNTNVDNENMDSVPGLLDHLERVGLKDKIDLIKFNPIVHIQENDNTSRVSRRADCAPVSEDWAMDNLTRLTWDAYARGFKTGDDVQFVVCSMKLDGTAVVIDPLGNIYTCPAFVGRDGFQVGDIYHEELYGRHEEFMSMKIPDDCLKCAYVPMCGGGCRHVAYTKYGDINRIICEKDYIARAATEALKMQVISQRGSGGN